MFFSVERDDVRLRFPNPNRIFIIPIGEIFV